MKKLEKIKSTLAFHKTELEQKYGVKQIGIFGSYVRGEQIKKSDLDILVDFRKKIGLLKFVHLSNYLSDLLGQNVDLVMKGALKPRISKNISKEVIYL